MEKANQTPQTSNIEDYENNINQYLSYDKNRNS